MDPSISPPAPGLLTLPAEIRNYILEYVFAPDVDISSGSSSGSSSSSSSSDDKAQQAPYGFIIDQASAGGLLLDNHYSAAARLRPLLVCRQLYTDAQLLALHRTTFVVGNLFAPISTRLTTLPPRPLTALRSIAFVADARHFRKLLDWGAHPFGVADLQLDTLTIVLHRSSFWHYLFDFTADLVALLRRLRGVARLRFVRNHASVKGSFRTWYHRLVGLIMKVDHRERYERGSGGPAVEATWWAWSFDERAQAFTLDARPPKRCVPEEEYLQGMAPLLEELRVGMENEEWNPDPRARNGA